MKTPREILLQQHQAAVLKLDAIRASVVAGIARPNVPEAISWREWVRSLRWHLAGMSAAWVGVVILNIDHSSGAAANLALEKTAPPQQIWAALRERQRLFLEYCEIPVAEPVIAPGRRSEIEPQQVAV
jgi:hypothetical protein